MNPAGHDDLSKRVEDLRAFEVDYRVRIRRHLEDLMGTLDGREVNLPLRAASRRLGEAPEADLRKVLAELPEPQRQRLLTVLLRIPVPEVTT